MVINNNSGKTINLTNINLTENEVCVNNKCLNMGYIFKYSPKIEAKTYYYYGEYKSNQDNYKILNEDNHVADVPLVTDNDPFISVSNGEAIEIILFWKWIEKDDIADTKIGIMAAEQGNTIYELTVRLDFETIDNTCEETP